MKKFLYNTRLFSLLVAIMVMICHMVIPHDHHMVDYGSNEFINCTRSENEDDHKPAFPSHCHALNDLVVENRTGAILIRQHRTSSDFIENKQNRFSLSFSTGKRIFSAVCSVCESDSHDLSLLRAPPVSLYWL